MDTIKLLIADDVYQIRLGLSKGIEWKKIGITDIIMAENGLAAWELFQQHLPDIIITDIKMPGLTGLELAERIRAVSPETVVILLSGYAEFEYAKEGIRLGVADYAVKPVNIEELEQVVKKYIRKKNKISGIFWKK